MARVSAAVVALVAGLSMTACLPPWEVPMIPEEPFVLNRPPRIIGTPEPKAVFTEIGNAPGCRLDFRVAVADPDIDDTIRVRYYVDYEKDPSTGVELEYVYDNTGTEQRQPADRPYTALLDQVVNPLHAPTPEDAPHVVEAVVFDGALNNAREPLGKEVPAGVAPDAGFINPSYVVIHRWLVRTVEGQTCP